MKYVLTLCFLASCTTPEFFKAADDILTDDAITIKVDRDAIREGIDVHVVVDVVNGQVLPKNR